MMQHNSSDDLPERTIEHVKNDAARRGFRQLFTDPLFIVREETDNDYGVDICIEALVNNGKSPSNIRAHVQLKSSSKKPNTDGTYSYSVSRKNLNYLLNSPCSFSAIFSTTKKIFYYRNADEVYHEYESLDSYWTTQDTITVKFRNRLNKKAIAVIHENLLNTAEIFNHLRLRLWKEGILPGMKFVYGELYFDSSDTVYQEYLESDDVGYVYRIDEEGKVIFLHNVVWERAHGPIPRGYQVYHINGNTLDNRRENLDIMKIKDVFNLGEYETEIEAAQAYNIGALITEGPSAELNDVPPPTFDTYDKVLSMLKNQGWTANDTEISQLKTLLREKLGMQL